MTESIADSILDTTGAQRIIKTHLIQELWSGYGHIYRCELEGSRIQSVVVKHVKLPEEMLHPRGWNTNISHQRKLKSYHVEMAWYSNLARQCDSDCRIPEIYHVSDSSDEMLMVMEDLNTAGFPLRKVDVTTEEIKSCLKWLAHFHAKFIGVRSEELWPVGTYWHLATRPDELEAMQDQALKAAAGPIDQTLNQAKYQCLVHGDAKLANFCFSENGRKVAAVDFQYIGHGCGMKDVAYLLSSCLYENDLSGCESELLSFYFDQLKQSLSEYGLCADFENIRQEWSVLYKYAWADFYRFLDGWSPGHWKMHRYSSNMKQQVLLELADSA